MKRRPSQEVHHICLSSVGKDGGDQSNILVFMSIGRLVIEGLVDMLASDFGAHKKHLLSVDTWLSPKINLRGGDVVSLACNIQ